MGLFLVGIGIAFFPKEIFKMKDTVMSVMTDITEKHTSQSDPTHIYTQLNLREHKHDAYTVRIVDLSDVSLNPITQITLKASPMLLTNEMSRDKEIKQFEDSITIALTKSDTSGRSHSSIYIPIAKELSVLSESTSDTKILVVYSDLIENTEHLSLYDTTIFNGDKIKNILKESFPLPNLKGIEVYLIFQPSTPNIDNAYTLISQVYKELLSDKGASVFIQANFLKTQ